jgi:hypothetical protein
VSGLRSALEEYRGEDLSRLPDARVEDGLTELQRMSELLELEKARWLVELDRRGVHRRDGHLSSASWLKARFHVSGAAASEAVRTARALEQMPDAREALEAGEISCSALRVLVHARASDPEAFEASEGLLTDAARRVSVADLHRVITAWRDRVLSERRDLRSGRRLHASVSFGGMVRIDGDLDPEAGETLLCALGAVIDAEARGPADEPDPRTPAQRRADALEQICRSYLDRADRPTVGGERPHLVVTVPLRVLASAGGTAGLTDPAGTPGLDRVGPVSPEVARRLGCDASVTRVVLGPRSEPLDVGRRTPVVPAPIRRALVVRDRSCRFPGCDRPHGWCDAHHVRHWAHGGSTALGNLVLLCRRHHRALHEGGFSARIEDGRAVFRRPDGTPLEDRGPPPVGSTRG